ncbi:MAG: F0F1 ATP synthase subunit B' [Alphaproteobacteria bacterium]|nr:F0F1 ATP synthase subunit B' [Alphaproteobacteria bacterium]MDE2335695.1 F0F1 ATP synthase subunit B' [Alphaproteobacteria bacterium]
MKRTSFIALSATAGLLPAAQAFAGDGAGGLPQMDVATFPSQLFWLGVSFVLVYAVMANVSLPRVRETLDGRRSRKDGHLDQAGRTNEEAEKVKKAYEKSLAEAQKKAAAAMAAAARDAGAKAAQEQSAFAESARKRLADAERNIAKAKTEALGSMASIATDIAADIARKVANMDVSAADAKLAVETAMKEGEA